MAILAERSDANTCVPCRALPLPAVCTAPFLGLTYPFSLGPFQCGLTKAEISKKASLARCPISDTNHHDFNVVLKDNDINFKLHLSPPDASRLASTLSADVRFLESQGIMDYSLLVGVHRHANRPPTQEELLKVRWWAGRRVDVFGDVCCGFLVYLFVSRETQSLDGVSAPSTPRVDLRGVSEAKYVPSY